MLCDASEIPNECQTIKVSQYSVSTPIKLHETPNLSSAISIMKRRLYTHTRTPKITYGLFEKLGSIASMERKLLILSLVENKMLTVWLERLSCRA